MTKNRIREWYDHWQGQVYVSFSGGKDSTVLKHIVDGMYDDIPAVFVNTGLEFPEIQRFVRDVKDGKFPCFNPDIEVVWPEMRFDETIKKYGYPVISKQIADAIEGARRNPNGSRMSRLKGECEPRIDGKSSKFNYKKWLFMLDAPFLASAKCCDMNKKKPVKRYEKNSGRKPIVATMAIESALRKQSWEKDGCNAYESNRPMSRPMSFWTEQDILRYIKQFEVPYCPVYGDIQIKQNAKRDELDGQVNMIDCLGDYNDADILEMTGYDRTGCVYCLFGCHLQKEPNRIQRLKVTHPKQYDYCMNGGEMVDGIWQPSKEGLGLRYVMEFLGIPYE